MGSISLEPQVSRETLAHDHRLPEPEAPVVFFPADLLACVYWNVAVMSEPANHSL